jgi:hypothetical protein
VSLKTFQIVVVGDLEPTLLQSLDGFHVVRAESGLTHLVGQVDDRFRLYDLLEALGDANVDLVSLNPAEESSGG